LPRPPLANASSAAEAGNADVHRDPADRAGAAGPFFAEDHPEIRDVTLEDIKAALEDAYLAGEASAKYIPPRS
jgi:hypothetical protein